MKLQYRGFKNYKKICSFVFGVFLFLALLLVSGCNGKEENGNTNNIEEKKSVESIGISEGNGNTNNIEEKKSVETISISEENGNANNIEEKKSVESISISKENLNVYIGEESTKLEVSVYPADAVYSGIEWVSSDTNVATVTDGVVTPISAGEVEIKAFVSGKVCSCSVKVFELFIEELLIEKMPTKTKFFRGDRIILDGLVLKGKMNNGKEKLFDSGFVSNVVAFEEIGKKNVTVTLQGKSVSYTVNVIEPLVESIRIATEPNKKDYVINSFLDWAGLTVELVYENGKTKVISEGFTVEGGLLSTVGTQKIKVSFGEKTAYFNVNVVPRAISSISVKTMPSNLWVVSGEKNNPKGLVLNVMYNDGTVETVDSGYTVSPEVFGETGFKDVTVQYGGVRCSYGVRVDEPTVYQFYCSKYSNRLSFFVGETFDPTGIELFIWYNNGVQLRLTEGFEVETPTFTYRGAHKIKVSYQGNVTWFAVTVVDVMVSRLEVTTLPNKMDYNLGDRFDPTGTVLKAYYNNGTSEIVTSGYTYDDIILNHYGDNYISYKYKEEHTSIKVHIEKPIES